MDHRKAGPNVGFKEEIRVVFPTEVLKMPVRVVFRRARDLVACDDRNTSLEKPRIRHNGCFTGSYIHKDRVSKIFRNYLIRKTSGFDRTRIVEIEIGRI